MKHANSCGARKRKVRKIKFTEREIPCYTDSVTLTYGNPLSKTAVQTFGCARKGHCTLNGRHYMVHAESKSGGGGAMAKKAGKLFVTAYLLLIFGIYPFYMREGYVDIGRAKYEFFIYCSLAALGILALIGVV